MKASAQLTSRLLLLCILLLLGGACKKIEDKVDQLSTISYTSKTNFTLPGSIALDQPFSFDTPDTDNPIKSQADIVKAATLEKTVLTIQTPPGQTFRFIKSIQFYLLADGLPQIEVANRTNIDNSVGTTLEMNTTQPELREYLQKDKFRLKTVVLTDENVLQEIKVQADLTFRIQVKI